MKMVILQLRWLNISLGWNTESLDQKLCVCVRECARAGDVFVQVGVCVCVGNCVCVHVCVCVLYTLMFVNWIYIYPNNNIYIYIYIYIYISN